MPPGATAGAPPHCTGSQPRKVWSRRVVSSPRVRVAVLKGIITRRRNQPHCRAQYCTHGGHNYADNISAEHIINTHHPVLWTTIELNDCPHYRVCSPLLRQKPAVSCSASKPMSPACSLPTPLEECTLRRTPIPIIGRCCSVVFGVPERARER